MSSRSMPTLTRTAAAAFDFDVVSDVKPLQSRAAPEPPKAGTDRKAAPSETSAETAE